MGKKSRAREHGRLADVIRRNRGEGGISVTTIMAEDGYPETRISFNNMMTRRYEYGWEYPLEEVYRVEDRVRDAENRIGDLENGRNEWNQQFDDVQELKRRVKFLEEMVENLRGEIIRMWGKG